MSYSPSPMGSDYQIVKVVEIDGADIVIEVVEEHPDMDAIHFLLTEDEQEYSEASLAGPLSKRSIHPSKTFEAANFAAQVLNDHGDTAFSRAAEEFEEEHEEDPDPEAFIANVRVDALDPVGEATNECWLYRARLRITMRDRAHLEGFVPSDETYRARASPTGDWDNPGR